MLTRWGNAVKMKLTSRTLDTLAYTKTGNAADYRWDDDPKGFGVRVYPSGRISFVLAYRNPVGRKRFLVLGAKGELTLTQARELARDKLAELRHGSDPQAEKSERRHELTFETFSERYIEFIKDKKRTWSREPQKLRDFIFPKIGSKKLSEVTAYNCINIHKDISATHSKSSANRVLALLRHMLNMAVKWKLIAESPCTNIPMFREPPPRDIVLTPEQCKQLIIACDADENIFAGSLFKVAMFSGRRVGELLNAKWEHLSADGKVLTMPETKAGERQFTYMNDLAIAAIQNVPRLAGNPYIFAGEQPGKPLVFYRRAWLRILKRTEIGHMPVHGLRHNYASLLVADGVPLETVGHLLGHKTSVTTRKYAHHRPDQLRAAAATFEKVIDLSAERHKRNASTGTDD